MPPVYNNGDSSCIVVGFVSGDAALRLRSLTDSELLKGVISQLISMFGTEAEEAYLDLHVQDWGSVPYIHCGYTHPSGGGSLARQALASPHANGRVVFCGEATNESADVTLQACMDGGRRAASELHAAAQKGGAGGERVGA